MSTYDYGFFEALTGPMKAAGDIQANRDAKKMQELQLMQQQRQMQLQELDRTKAMQSQLTSAQEDANADLYDKNKFARQKDTDDFRDWHTTGSGWEDIQAILREYGSVDNARLYGNLDYVLAEYKSKLKNNPISKRVNKNKAALELYKSYALSKGGNDKFLTTGSKQRYQDWKDNKTDYFTFNGGRGDYLNESKQTRNPSDEINLEEVLYDNYSGIRSDIILDANPSNVEEFAANLTDDKMLAWLKEELQYSEIKGTSYFGGEAIYGDKEIDTTFHTELDRMLKTTNKTGIITGDQFFFNLNLDKGETFHKLFNDIGLGQEWARYGGYDPNAQTKSYVGMKAMFAKGTQVASSGRALTNQGIETKVTQILFGNHTDSEVSRYNSKTREIQDIRSTDLFDSRGHKITDSDVGLDSEFFSMTEESETMDLKLSGYFVALKGTGADGMEILLTDVANESDRAKLMKEYKDVQFQPVLVAELIDFDTFTHNDAYYKQLDMSDMNVRMALNEAVDPSKINEVLTQKGTYEENLANSKMDAKRKVVANAKLQKQLNLPSPESVEQLVSGYDKSLTVSLGMSSVPAVKIQQVLPMIMSDLFIESQKERTYPYVFNPEEVNPEKQMIAETPGQYMAYSTKILQEGLISGNPSYAAMLEAIKTGEYDQYSQTLYDEKTHNQSRKISQNITKYQRNN
tara:strand:+ start:3069 stop:5129 length:2061 start_codon:yes stop_codon:yes gene_type:complete